MRQIATRDTVGIPFETVAARFPNNFPIKSPRRIGTMTTCTIERNIPNASTFMVVPRYAKVRSGVRIGASKVFTAVMLTERATSP